MKKNARKKPLIDKHGEVRELTRADFRRMSPAREVEADLVAASLRRVRGRQKAPTKTPVSVRLSPEVLAHFKATGAGWQTRLDEALKLLVGSH
jgi:uncharacterized protein (DUF4415 family)